MSFRFFAVACLSLLATFAAPAADPPARPNKFAELFADEVVARGKGVEVKRSQLDEAFIAYKANLAARGQSLGDDERTVRESQLLDRLIVTQLLINRVTDADRAKALETAEKFTAESKKSAPNEDAFNRQLRALGMTPEKFKSRVMEQALAEAVIGRELTSGITVSDTQVVDLYQNGNDLLVSALQEALEKLIKDPKAASAQIADLKQRIDSVRKANLARLEQPEKVRVSHVFISTRDRKSEEELPNEQKKLKRQQAEKVRVRALAGEDFPRLVLELSEDRGVAETKGEYTFSRNDPFSAEFKAAGFSLKPGDISDVVTSPFGYHVIKCLEKIPTKKVELEKVSKDLKEFLTQQEVQKAMPDFFRKLKKDAAVEILQAKYRVETAETDPRKPAQ
jgi:parvulin-like peptidyl-prolyl isomerase